MDGRSRQFVDGTFSEQFGFRIAYFLFFLFEVLLHQNARRFDISNGYVRGDFYGWSAVHGCNF